MLKPAVNLLLLFFIVNQVHFRLFPIEVVYTSVIFDGVIAVGCYHLLKFFFSNKIYPLNFANIIIFTQSVALYAFIPTIVDRSLSIYVIEKIAQAQNGLRLSQIDNLFVDNYIVDHKLLSVRLTEQSAGGTIDPQALEDGCVRISDKGLLAVKIISILRIATLPNTRLVLGEETTDLRNPAENSSPIEIDPCVEFHQ